MSWRRILLLTAILFATLSVATWFVLQRTGAATGLVRGFLDNLLATRFRLENARVDLFGGNLLLEQIAIADPTREGRDLVAADSLQLGVETDPLGNVLAIHEVAVDGLQVDLDLTGDHEPSLPRLLKSSAAGGGSPIDTVTPARISRGKARVRVDAEVPALEFSRVELELQRTRTDDGTADRQRGVLHGSAHCDNLGVGVQLLGELDLVAQRVRLQASIGELKVDADFIRRLLPLLRTQLRDDVASGRLEELTLQIELPLDAAEGAVASAAFAFAEVDCTLPELPVPLKGASVRGTVSTRDGGTAKFTGEKLLPTGDTEVIAKVTDFFSSPHLEVRGKGRRISIDQTVRAALGSFNTGRAVVDGLRPTAGTADFDLYLRAVGTDDEVVDLDLQLHDVALSYHGFGREGERVAFPLPIVDAQGRVHLRDDVVSIEDVTAKLAPEAGGGEITMTGRVDPGRSGPERVSIDLHAPELMFTPALRAAFAELVRDEGALYDQFQPRGTAAVRLRVRPTETSASTWQVTVEPQGAEGRWQGFPLPLQDVRGQIVARAEGLQVDLQASYGQARATLRGRMMAPPDHPGALAGGSIDLRIAAEAVPLDDELHQASLVLAPQLEKVWLDLVPQGNAAATLNVRRAEADAPLVYDLVIALQDVHAMPRSFPMPVTHAHGDIFVHGRGQHVEVNVDALRGSLQEATGGKANFAVVGTIRSDAAGYLEDLTAVVRDMELDAELGRTLEASGAVGRGTWDVLRPSGKVDLICRQETEDARETRHYSVLLRGVKSEAEMLPRTATEITGELLVEDGVLRFDDLRAKVGDSLVTCGGGYVGPATEPSKTEVAFTVSAERFQLDDTFARLFVGPMRQAVLERQLRGAVNINGLQLRFVLPGDGSDTPIETVLQGQVEALDVELLLGTRLQQVNGVVTIDESRVTRDGGTLAGSVSKGSLRLFGHPCVDVQSEFTADAERFVLRDLVFSLHGGRVLGRTPGRESLVYELARTPAGQGRLAADLEFSGMSLREFLQTCGLVGTPYHGTAQGWIDLQRLDGYDFVDMQAKGALQIADGNLGTVPMFTAIYALLDESSRPRFENLAVEFGVGDRTVDLENLSLRSPLIAVHGGGKMTMEGYLDVVLTTDSFLGGGADMLLLPPVIQMITSNLVRFHLFGPVRDLHAEQRWFAQRDPRRRHLMPVPPRVDRVRRPDF